MHIKFLEANEADDQVLQKEKQVPNITRVVTFTNELIFICEIIGY